MLTLNSTQSALVALDNKTVKWVFYIYDKNGVGYSFVSEPIGGNAWATGITWDSGITWDDGSNLSNIILTNFSGIELHRNMAENTIIAPSETSFNISNPDNMLDFLDFKGGSVVIELYLSAVGYSDTKIAGWGFKIKTANPGYQNLKIVAQDFLQDYLKGYYPNTRYPEDIFPSNRTYSTESLCVPVPFGIAYVPLRDVFIAGEGGFIMLGDPALTYTISAIRSPRDWGLKTEYLSISYTFTQSTKADVNSVNWRVFQAIIADSDGNGTADAAGFWGTSGGNILDPPVKFTRSDTATMTNPADIISFVLQDMGVPVAKIDVAVTFAAAHTKFDTWGLEFNGAFWQKQEREKVLANLLNQCHSYLSIGEKIELHVISKTSRKAITGAEVLRTSEQGEGSFTYSDIVISDYSDSGYVAWQTEDESHDLFIKTLVAVDAVANVISDDVLEAAFVDDSENIKRIGILYYQRKYLKEAEIGATLKGTCLALQPDDVITINANNYGGNYAVLVDSVKINKDITIEIGASKYINAFQDWEDLTVVPLVVPTDDTDNSWKPVISGPDDGVNTNVLPGRIRIGQTSNNIVFDPTDPLRISVNAGGVEKMRMGNLHDFLDYTTDIYGFAIGESNKYLKYDPTNGLRIAGAITGSTLDIGGDDTSSFHVDIDGNIWSGASIANKATAPFRVSNAGVLYASGATIRGTLNAGDLADGYVAAARFQAGSLTANMIGTNEIVATSARIDTAAVTTIKIADQAVTIPVSAYGTTGVSIPNGTWTTILQASITSTGAPIMIIALSALSLYSGPFLQGAIKIIRDSTELSFYVIPIVYNAGIFPLNLSDTPGAGNHTYYLQAWSSSSAGTANETYIRSLLLLETKK